MRRFWVVFFCLCWGGFAFANPDEARTYFAQAEERYTAQDFSKAIEFYAAAYRAEPDPAYLYDLAQCYRRSGDSSSAAELLTRYLAEAPDASNRAAVEEAILVLRQTPPTVVLALPVLTVIPSQTQEAPIETPKTSRGWLYTVAGAGALLTTGGILALFFNGPGVPNTALGHQDGFRE